jgi:putative ABC transport system ATP-binding protein
MSDVDSVLTIFDLHKTFDAGKPYEVPVLKGIDLKMKSGDFFALMGPSGSGKSTLLNIVGGLVSSSKGEIEISGKSMLTLNDRKLTELRRNEIGWIFQSFGLIENLTAFENVIVPLNLNGIDGKQAEEKAISMLELVGLADRIHHFPDALSGGQKQRVAIARSLVNDPKIILADEPTGNLDTKTGKEIVKVFRMLANKGLCILMVTHDIKLAHESDKVYILHNGKIEEER